MGENKMEDAFWESAQTCPLLSHHSRQMKGDKQRKAFCAIELPFLHSSSCNVLYPTVHHKAFKLDQNIPFVHKEEIHSVLNTLQLSIIIIIISCYSHW